MRVARPAEAERSRVLRPSRSLLSGMVQKGQTSACVEGGLFSPWM